MSDLTAVRRHLYGPLYWAPVPIGLLATFYAGMCLEGYWDTGKLGVLALAIFASSLGATLVTAGIQSYTLAGVNALFTILNVLVVAHSGQWLLMYLPFMSAIFAITAGYARGRHAAHVHNVNRVQSGGSHG